MHEWGDDWPHWETLNNAVERAYELCDERGMEYEQIKEKYGTLRLYVPMDVDRNTYRCIYEQLCEEFPEVREEIIGGADESSWLYGIVPPGECGHKMWYHAQKRRWCAICGRVMNTEEDDDQ